MGEIKLPTARIAERNGPGVCVGEGGGGICLTRYSGGWARGERG